MIENRTALSKPVDVHIVPSTDESFERAQVDVQISTARRYPRSLELFREQALKMATVDQETAESCIYRRPVGKKRGSNQVEYAEGASIRLAEIVAVSWGNIRVAARIVEQTERFVKCEGVAWDLQTNYAGTSQAIEPTVKSDGTPYSEGMRAVVAKACLAKVYRDAVFKVVPRAMCKQVYEQAKKVAAGTEKSLDDRRAKAKSWLQLIKVDDARVFAALGVTEWSQIGNEHLLTLTGLKTAINDQDTRIDEAFPLVAKAPEGFVGDPPTSQTQPSPPPVKQEPPKPREATGGVQSQPETQKPQESKPESEPGQARQQDPEPEPTEPANSAGAPVFPPTKGPGETEALSNLRYLMNRDGVTEVHVMAYCKGDGKMAKAQTKLSELSDAKLLTLARAWPNILPKIKGVAA